MFNEPVTQETAEWLETWHNLKRISIVDAVYWSGTYLDVDDPMRDHANSSVSEKIEFINTWIHGVYVHDTGFLGSVYVPPSDRDRAMNTGTRYNRLYVYKTVTMRRRDLRMHTALVLNSRGEIDHRANPLDAARLQKLNEEDKIHRKSCSPEDKIGYNPNIRQELMDPNFGVNENELITARLRFEVDLNELHDSPTTSLDVGGVGMIVSLEPHVVVRPGHIDSNPFNKAMNAYKSLLSEDYEPYQYYVFGGSNSSKYFCYGETICELKPKYIRIASRPAIGKSGVYKKTNDGLVYIEPNDYIKNSIFETKPEAEAYVSTVCRYATDRDFNMKINLERERADIERMKLESERMKVENDKAKTKASRVSSGVDMAKATITLVTITVGLISTIMSKKGK